MQPNAPLGPLRHPKPLTPSDFHSMLEKEQEAMVCNESSWDTMTLVKLMQCRSTGKPSFKRAFFSSPTNSLRSVDSVVYLDYTE